MAHHCINHLALKVAGATACLWCFLIVPGTLPTCSTLGGHQNLAMRANPKLSCCRRRSSSSRAWPQQQQGASREQQAQAQADAHSANLKAHASAEAARFAGAGADHPPGCAEQPWLCQGVVPVSQKTLHCMPP